MKRIALQRELKNDQWVKPFFKQYKKALALALFLGVITFVFAAGLMFDAGYMISKAAEVPGNIMLIYFPTLFARVFGIGKPALQYLERLTSHDWVLRMTSNLRLKLYNVLEKDAVFFRRNHKTGQILGLLSEDIGHLQNLYLRTIFPTVIAWFIYLILVIALGFFSLGFASIMLLLLGVTVIVMPLVSVLINGARQARRKAAKNELYSELTDNVLGVSDWVFAGRSQEYLSRYKEAEYEVRKDDAALHHFARNRDVALQVVFGVVLVLILMWAGEYFGGSYGGQGNWIAAFVLGFIPLIDAFAPLSDAALETNIYSDSIKRFNELPDNADTAPQATSLKAPFSLEIKGVSFRYAQTSQVVLDDLSLSITQGQKIAILGRSGAGKSTLASLIRGDLSPDAGSVTLNGFPTRLLGDDISRYVGIIQQQTYLFNMSLADNLRIGNQTASEEDLWTVLDRVGLKEMALRLPEKLDTLVDEAGMRFSGGERHRIALARVLLQDAPIIILDEPTVGLDPLTERDVLETIFSNIEDRTVIMITHHLQGVSLMDTVIFIEDGKLAMSGSPEELAKSNPHYQQLQSFDRGIDWGRF